MWTFISYFFFFSLLLGDDSSWITTTLWNCKKCFNITEPVIWLCMISHFLWLLDKWYTRYTSDRLWSCVFTLVFEDEIKDVAQKGEKGDQVTISLIISLQTSFIQEKLVLASNIWHHSVKSDFPAYQLLIPERTIILHLLFKVQLCLRNRKYRGTITAQNSKLRQADYKGHWCSYGPDVKMLSAKQKDLQDLKDLKEDLQNHGEHLNQIPSIRQW